MMQTRVTAALAAAHRLLKCISRKVEPNGMESKTGQFETAGIPRVRGDERESHLPRISRHAWERADLTRMLRTEDEYAPYVFPLPSLPRCQSR